jgi:hypothetical protein
MDVVAAEAVGAFRPDAGRQIVGQDVEKAADEETDEGEEEN